MTRRRELVARPAAELAAPLNPVAVELGGIVGELPAGVYRMHTTICRVEFNRDGTEKRVHIVSQHCFDFDSKPGTAALPAVEPAPETDGA